MIRLLTRLLSCFLAASPALADPVIGTDTSPDGKAVVQCDLPAELRHRNTVGLDGSGLCVFWSITHSARYHSVVTLFDLGTKMEQEEGGGYPEKVDKMLAKYAPNVEYVQHTGHDLTFLKTALRSGRMAAVTYSGQDPFYGMRTKIAHMVNLVHLTDGKAAILDNNHPKDIVWMTEKEFADRWDGWAVVLAAPAPPPPPKNKKVSLPVVPLAVYGQCPGGVCPNQRLVVTPMLPLLQQGPGPAPREGLPPLPPGAVAAPAQGGRIYWLRIPGHEEQWGLFDIVFSRQLGALRQEGFVRRNWDGSWANFVSEPLYAVPDEVKADFKPVEAASPVPNFGIDVDKLKAPRPDHTGKGGKKLTTREALDLVGKGNLPDDGNLPFLTVFAPKAQQSSAVAALQPLASVTRLNAYDLADPMVKGLGFVTGTYLQDTDGSVIARWDGVATPDEVQGFLRRRDPNYDPARDGSSTLQGLGTLLDLGKLLHQAKQIPAVVWIGGGILVYLLLKKKDVK